MTSSPDDHEFRDDDNLEPHESLSWISPILAQLGVASFSAKLSGGGDSGDLDEIEYHDSEGELLDTTEIETALRAIKAPGSSGDMTVLDLLNDQMCSDASEEGNWYDNDGGSVESSYLVRPQGIITEFVNISYHAPDYDEDYDDEDEEYEDEPEDEGMTL